jgi:excisionase family DNA binding protein
MNQTTLTTKEVANRLKVSKRTVERMIADGEFTGIVHRVRRLIRFHAARFEEWHERTTREF